MIRRVRIQGYKSLKDIEVELQPLTVIIGPNAAGKSNLFDALGLLSRLVTSQTLGEAFQGHRGDQVEAFSYHEKGLEHLVTQPTALFTIGVDVGLSPRVVKSVEQRIRKVRGGESSRDRITETWLRYTLTVEMEMESGRLGVRSEQLAALDPDGKEKETPEAFIHTERDRLYLRVEGEDRSSEYTVGNNHTLLSSSLYPPYHPHAVALREELSCWRFYYLDPETMRAENPLKEIETVGPFGADLAAFFHTMRARDPDQFRVLNRALPSLLPDVQEIGVKRTDEGTLRLLVWENKVPYSARVISEGTLRVLGLLAITYPLAPTTVIGYEEPENGVHPRRLSLIAELLQNAADSGKQILVNTHSPKLPEYFAPTSLVICRKVEGATTFMSLEGLGLPLYAERIEEALEETPVTERLLRGDFGG